MVSSAKARTVVTTQRRTKDKEPPVLEKCTVPLTRRRCVDRITPEKAVFVVRKRKA